MKEIKTILERIKKSVAVTAPGSTIILYGSFARGDNHKESDLDILILVEKDKVDWESGKQLGVLLSHSVAENHVLPYRD